MIEENSPDRRRPEPSVRRLLALLLVLAPLPATGCGGGALGGLVGGIGSAVGGVARGVGALGAGAVRGAAAVGRGALRGVGAVARGAGRLLFGYEVVDPAQLRDPTRFREEPAATNLPRDPSLPSTQLPRRPLPPSQGGGAQVDEEARVASGQQTGADADIAEGSSEGFLPQPTAAEAIAAEGTYGRAMAL